MKKRVFSIFLAVLLCITTASCTKSYQEDDIRTEAMSRIDFSEEPVTITYLTIGDKPTNGETERVVDELNRILEKRLNARLDIYYIGWADYLENYNRAVSDPNMSVDLIGTATDWLDAWPNVINGHFLPLSEDMLKTYCGITYTNISKATWRDCSYDGNIYFIPENEFTQWTNHGFAYRDDIAREAGLYEVASWEDLDKYFDCVARKHPEMIAWDADTTDPMPILGYLMSSMKYAPIYELTSYGLWGEDQDNPGRIISPYYTGKQFIEYAKLMKSWNDKGVFRTEGMDIGDNEAEFYAGESSVHQDQTQNYFSVIKPRMQVEMPDVNIRFFWFGKESGNLMKVSKLHGAMAISAYSRNPERALMVYDMLRNDEECYRLIRYGIEGRQYDVTSQNTVEQPNGYNEIEDSILTNFWWGRRDEYELPNTAYAWDDYYDLVNSYEHVAVPYPWEGIPFSTPLINNELKAIVPICEEYLPVIASGRYAGPAEEKVAEFRARLMNAGFERITGQLQRIYDSQ